MRCNPKRKAADAGIDGATLGGGNSDPLEEALLPMSRDEIRQWSGWCELESEPAKYGVEGIKIQEIFSFDDDVQSMLPQPVYGLIFLYQYFAESYEDDETETQDVWFANQTTDNACATLAMMNIIMNIPDICLGPELQAFKDSTKHLSFPLRGHALDTNAHLRTIHNSLTRRMEHLNADLLISNKAESFKKKINRRKAPAKSAGSATGSTARTLRKKKKKLKIDSDSGFHFIALVPANGSLWELDGLKPGPVNLGPVSEDGDFVSAARPFIQARIMQFDEGAVHFNIMALCRSPSAAASDRLAKSIQHFDVLNARAEGNDEFVSLIAGDKQPLALEDVDKLKEVGLTPQVISTTQADPAFRAKTNNPSLETSDLYKIHNDLVQEQKQALAEYRDEQVSLGLEDELVKGRKKDNMIAIHRWLERIAEHGKLQEMIEEDA